MRDNNNAGWRHQGDRGPFQGVWCDKRPGKPASQLKKVPPYLRPNGA